MGIISSLSRDQREATAILQVGTFLEYFDLMIYVHMAVILNDIFFPKTDPHTANLISAITFCSTFIFRPFGAILFGYIGDNYGRKITVVITTVMMALCCATMAVLPTYAQIGVTAAWVVVICRIVQGMSSMGEIIGAQIYLTELIKVPERYPVVSFINCADYLGGVAALGIASMVLAFGLDWRIIFWFGALIATVGIMARTALRETPDFVNAKLRLKKQLEITEINVSEALCEDPIVNEQVKKRTSLAYFFIQCSHPVWFYFLYVYCSSIFKNSYMYDHKDIIQHNLLLAAIEFSGIVFFSCLSYKVHPLKILRFKMVIMIILILLLPYLLFSIATANRLFLIQILICIFKPSTTPAGAIFFAHFPVFKRFTYSSFLYALSRALMYVVTSFGLVYLTKLFGSWGLLIIFIPVLIGFNFGISHFKLLEEAAGNYPRKK